MSRVPALDGLRGVAILLVVGYHARTEWFPGGSVGVTLFFVLSGYLITRLLLDDLERFRSVRWGRFYWRRALRLLPALLVFVAGFLAVGGRLVDAVPTLTYTANFYEATGRTLGVLGHSWSLAVEEHFYLMWPLVLAAIWTRHRAVAAVAGVAVAWRVAMLVAGADWERVYYSTDTVAFALLAGCALAARRWSPRFPMVALAALVGVAVLVPAKTAPYLWVETAAVVAAVAAVAGAERIPGLDASWLRWFGRRSYALYLWHPLTLALTGSALAGIALALVVAEASWRLVEAPAQRLRTWRPRWLESDPVTVG